MAVLHKKEEKLQAVLGRLPKKYSHEEFVAMFIQLFSKDWGRIKSAYVKQTQDKEPGTVINMPKPELYLKQVLDNFLSQKAQVEPTSQAAAEVEVETPVAPKKTKKTAVKKVAEQADEEVAPKPKATKKKVAADEPVKTKKTAAKK